MVKRLHDESLESFDIRLFFTDERVVIGVKDNGEA